MVAPKNTVEHFAGAFVGKQYRTAVTLVVSHAGKSPCVQHSTTIHVVRNAIQNDRARAREPFKVCAVGYPSVLYQHIVYVWMGVCVCVSVIFASNNFFGESVCACWIYVQSITLAKKTSCANKNTLIHASSRRACLLLGRHTLCARDELRRQRQRRLRRRRDIIHSERQWGGEIAHICMCIKLCGTTANVLCVVPRLSAEIPN